MVVPMQYGDVYECTVM